MLALALVLALAACGGGEESAPTTSAEAPSAALAAGVRREGEWSIGIVYADSLANWKTVYSDPETELACGNVQPWG